ncbi:SDR family NAD(P)-dependent oxidoreductase [Brevibacillus ruminantium]|uniref:SDR family NAD(P)-dependent oxidoreductase n=1 Tax=Brevibacillus ruminantium TaxID=2950604 RepID=A0ABY4WFM4_9BACL|nr:SDR family NAD(P)-dependent oxidoreductase [Brevibacillus ruminantium]USG65953.1 SDR family NAD(P)-dependent oxidoreductase [Brevibacillus ruminantium]
MKKFLIFGGSKGLGDAFVKGLPEAGDRVWIVSRSRPETLERADGVERLWIEADLSTNTASLTIADALQGEDIDVLIYNVGIWESKGFVVGYDFEQDDPSEIAEILQVNLTSTITCIQKLLPNLKKAKHAKIILIGSTAGLENTGFAQVTFAASKFGLRGIAHSLRAFVKKFGISVTCINPGAIATQVPYEAGPEKVIAAYQGSQIPLQDIVSLVKCVIHLSPASCVKEIHIPAMENTRA